jgi:hypothetical protein
MIVARDKNDGNYYENNAIYVVVTKVIIINS